MTSPEITKKSATPKRPRFWIVVQSSTSWRTAHSRARWHARTRVAAIARRSSSRRNRLACTRMPLASAREVRARSRVDERPIPTLPACPATQPPAEAPEVLDRRPELGVVADRPSARQVARQDQGRGDRPEVVEPPKPARVHAHAPRVGPGSPRPQPRGRTADPYPARVSGDAAPCRLGLVALGDSITRGGGNMA